MAAPDFFQLATTLGHRVTVNSAAGNTSSCTLLRTSVELAKVIFGGYRFFGVQNLLGPNLIDKITPKGVGKGVRHMT